MKPWWLNGIPSLAVGMPPLSGDLLSLLPQQRCTFATALQEGCILRLVVGLCCRSSNSSPSSTTAPAMMPTTTTTMKRQSRWHIPAFVPVCWGAGIQSRIPVPAGFRRNPAATSLMFHLFSGPELYFRSGPESVPV